ncbi:MAG TPA: PKD domain-containing protein, partial [Cryomorphaceae bacterium]|nr:PKD domain-containing protein [Cryomorphaceae bacterium]
QKLKSVETKTDSEWEALGPVTWEGQNGWNPGLGRINAITEDPVNADIVYVCTPAGGLWKSNDAGQSWTPLTDNLPAIGASGLAIDPNNTDILYLATGDGDGNDTYSLGVLKSIDGGETWETTSLAFQVSEGVRCSKILMDPNNSERLWVATHEGLYTTSDGGASWVEAINDIIRDIEVHPTLTSQVYASGRRFYKSTDGGENFDQVFDGVPGFGDVNRLAIATTPANSNYVYMVAGSNETSGFHGLYRSTDGGDTFELRSDSPNILTYSAIGDGEGGQSWYDLAIAADPENEDLIYVGGINVWSSSNGGSSWDIKSHWVYPSSIGYTHADIHSLDFYENTLYCGSDGGIFKTNNGGNIWTDLSEGLQISQFYRIAVSATDPNLVLTASQDNGTNLFSGESQTYQHLLGGDGNGAAIDYTNDDIMYSAYPGGGFQKSTDGGNNFFGFDSGIDENGAWVTPLELHPENPEILFAAYENVWKNTNGNWVKISDLPVSSTLRALRVAPSDPNVIYTSGPGLIFKTTDGGENWNSITTGLPDLTITAIEVHPENSEEIWVTLSGYEDGNKVFHSENGGDDWSNISENLPNVPANCITYQIGSEDALYVGTDVGVFYLDANNINWLGFNEGLPNVIVNQIVLHYASSTVFVGTFGRGVWKNEFANAGQALPLAGFNAEERLICAGQSVSFTNQSFNTPPDGVLWTFEGGTPATSTELNPTVTYSEGGFYPVELIVTNENGSDVATETDYIEVLSQQGEPGPFEEDFEVALGLEQTPFYVDNLDDGNTWELNSEVGFESSQSAWIQNFTNVPLSEDLLESSTFDLSGLDTAFVTMRVAYAERTNSSLERFKVSISTDCGETWTFKKLFTSSTVLPSAPPTDQPWAPEDDTEWNYLVVDNIEPEERTENFRVQFSFRSNGGNNIYVDDINIGDELIVTSTENPEASLGELNVFPNPAAGDNVSVEVTLKTPSTTQIELLDVLGKTHGLVWNGFIESSQTIQIPTGNLPGGIYAVRVKSESGQMTKTVVVE